MPLYERTEDFDYHLPDELIASRPLAKRDESRMLVVNQKSGTIEHHRFRDFLDSVEPGDLTVLNDTKVVPARYFSNDGRVELLRLESVSKLRWRCMVKPGKRMKIGREVEIGEATGTVEEILEDGNRVIQFDRAVDVAIGHLALPPYMNRMDDSADAERYQTVFAKNEGAIAAPTAGLHLTPDLLRELNHAFVTLHVGAGTFLPLKVDRLDEHKMHTEKYDLSQETVESIQRSDRVIAIGTTVVRVLEHCAKTKLEAGRGETDIFIYPPYDFQVVGGLLTNFHLPKSTLLMLVSAFAGRDLMMEAYAKAIEARYRFYSYGDCMLIL